LELTSSLAGVHLTPTSYLLALPFQDSLVTANGPRYIATAKSTQLPTAAAPLRVTQPLPSNDFLWIERPCFVQKCHSIKGSGMINNSQLNSSVELSPSSQPVSRSAAQKFDNTVGKRKVHYRVHECPQQVAKVIQFASLCLIPPRSTLMLTSFLHLVLPSGLFPCGFPTKILCAFLVFPRVLNTNNDNKKLSP
jgi:hypothetical protein